MFIAIGQGQEPQKTCTQAATECTLIHLMTFTLYKANLMPKLKKE